MMDAFPMAFRPRFPRLMGLPFVAIALDQRPELLYPRARIGV
jgi:hypothetical protein